LSLGFRYLVLYFLLVGTELDDSQFCGWVVRVFAGTVSVSQSIEGMESFAFMCHADFVVRKKETSKTLMD